MLPAVDADRFAIRELVENWALWRDAGDWERFAAVWHPTDGWMTATWFQGPAPDFIAASRQGFDAGVSILGHLGYLQAKAGFTVKTGLPGLTGEAVTRLYGEGAGWLDGSPSPGEPR